MAAVFFVLQLLIEAAFAILAIRTVIAWTRHPDRRYGNLSLALGSLAAVILASPQLGVRMPYEQLVTDGVLVAFLVSGYGLVMFRDSFVPFGAALRRAITIAIVAIGILAIAVELPANPDSPHNALQTLALVGVIGAWSFCILEPIVTFWTAARGRPAVERARLHAISIGYAGLLAVVLLGVLGGVVNPSVSFVIDLIALATVPILYVAFFPPVWLRRIWRQPEEDQFRRALHDLLLYSPDRKTLADRALGWAERLVGGDSAFVLDADGSVLAARGMQDGAALALNEKGSFLTVDGGGDHHAPWRSGTSVVVPLDLRQGHGAMVILSGRLTPMFGDDEMNRLRQYAASVPRPTSSTSPRTSCAGR
jgi:hypothetical protein